MEMRTQIRKGAPVRRNVVPPCLGRDLVLLAALADQQLEYFHRTSCPREELSNQWLSDDDPMLHQLIEVGALTPELERTALEITNILDKYGQEVGDEIQRIGHFAAIPESVFRTSDP